MSTGNEEAIQAIALLSPTRRELVYDILRDGIHADVSDWSNYRKGSTAPAANPKYCYEWSFTQDQHVVLNLWHASFKARGADVVCELNMRAYANEIARAKDEPWREKKPKPVWEKRARNMDLAVQYARRKSVPIRVIVCEGNMRDSAAGDEKASEVKRRMLDPMAWYIETYDLDSGRTILRRGTPQIARPLDEAGGMPASPPDLDDARGGPGAMRELPPSESEPGYVDQFDNENSSDPPERRDVSGSVFVRSPEVRTAALRRAKGVCQLCGQPGFKTASRKIYLETHHVVPLSEGGLDVLSNVVALCATDHRRAHFDEAVDGIRLRLLAIAEAQCA